MRRKEILVKLLENCGSKILIEQLHTQCLKLGLSHDRVRGNQFFCVLYTKYAPIRHANILFEETPYKTAYLWNSMLRSLCRKRAWEKTLCLFRQMIVNAVSAKDRPDSFTLSVALKSCTGLLDLELGKTIHGFAKKQMDADMFVGSALIEPYGKCGQMNDAAKAFTEYSRPDVVLWKSMVTGYGQNGNPREALSVFSCMTVLEHVNPDPVTLVSAVSACAKLSDCKLGSSIHGFVIRRGFTAKLASVNSLLNLYAKTGAIKIAAYLFKDMSSKDIISWSTMVACYANNGAGNNALDLFNKMIDKGVEPNSITVVSALRACALTSNLEVGIQIHKLAVAKDFELDVSVSTALIDMYMKCYSPENAINIFKRMPKKDVVTWASLINGYAKIGMAHISMEVFCKMLSHGTRPDAVAIVKILTASSGLGILQQAACLHGFVLKIGFNSNVFIEASLIELYAKCGSIYDANKVFKVMIDKDVIG